MLFSFVKYQGSGNDFIVIDDRLSQFPIENTPLIQNLCHRSWGIGADGLILAQKSASAHAKMRIFNSDGHEASMCGNGLRCLALFLGMNEMLIESAAGLHKCSKKKEGITTSFGIPKLIHSYAEMQIWNTGVPHAVLFVEDLSSIDISSHGRKIRYDERFAPEGVNATFVQATSEALYIRTYERGVEGETLACGTGAVAAAAAYMHKGHTLPIRVIPPSTHVFEITQESEELILTGPAQEVFKGEINI